MDQFDKWRHFGNYIRLEESGHRLMEDGAWISLKYDSLMDEERLSSLHSPRQSSITSPKSDSSDVDEKSKGRKPHKFIIEEYPPLELITPSLVKVLRKDLDPLFQEVYSSQEAVRAHKQLVSMPSDFHLKTVNFMESVDTDDEGEEHVGTHRFTGDDT